jgi:hypothetical protein
LGIQSWDLAAGRPVILYLQAPKEKIWGILVSLTPSGVEEVGLGLSTIFYPMSRLERMERDETLGPLLSYADRFLAEVGRTVFVAAGLEPEPER